jgi:hypothetical protein
VRLIGVTMVRNEADIVEASVRHNLGVLDGMVVVEHGSVDRTPEILAGLQREGLRLHVVPDDRAEFFQARRLTAVARQAMTDEHADFVFPIDADEFVKVASRQALEQELSALPHGAHAALHWFTYVPESFDAQRLVGPSHLRWRLAIERHGNYKCIIGRSFAEHPEQCLGSGNHFVDDPTASEPPPHIVLRPEVVALAHCPVRSSEQLRQKVLLGYPAHMATRPLGHKQAFHWMELHPELSADARLSDARLREIACNYGVPKRDWQSADSLRLVEDPVLAPVPYPHAQPAPDR